jgi:exodeoxyribonuclease-3
MKIYSWNVNGIRAVHKKGLLQSFVAEHSPDILCLQETKANYDQSEVDFPEYEEYWCSADKKGYSGTAIFTKFPPEEVFCGFPPHITEKYPLQDVYGDTTKEGRVLTLEFADFYVCTVYTPNAKDDLSRIPMRQAWDPAFCEYVKELEFEKPVIFCGDLNVAHAELDLARPKENKGKKGFTEAERNGIQTLVDVGFVDTFRQLHPNETGQYSWWSHFANARARNVGWRIDYVFVSASLVPLIKNARIHSAVMGSDHCPVSIDVALEL